MILIAAAIHPRCRWAAAGAAPARTAPGQWGCWKNQVATPNAPLKVSGACPDIRPALMVQSFPDVGQLEPIEVASADANGRYRLIIGAHPVAAAHVAEMEVRATIFEGTPQQMRLREIGENVYRAGLNALDQAAFLAKRRAIWEELYGPIQAGRPSQTHNPARLAGLSSYSYRKQG